MKKAEIIKNGNVNLKPINTGIDWVKITKDFSMHMSPEADLAIHYACYEITKWFKKRIEKELQASGSNP
jgi:hypothetical protein